MDKRKIQEFFKKSDSAISIIKNELFQLVKADCLDLIIEFNVDLTLIERLRDKWT